MKYLSNWKISLLFPLMLYVAGLAHAEDTNARKLVSDFYRYMGEGNVPELQRLFNTDGNIKITMRYGYGMPDDTFEMTPDDLNEYLYPADQESDAMTGYEELTSSSAITSVEDRGERVFAEEKVKYEYSYQGAKIPGVMTSYDIFKLVKTPVGMKISEVVSIKEY